MNSSLVGRKFLVYTVVVFGYLCLVVGATFAQKFSVGERKTIAGKILSKTNHSLVVQTESGDTVAAYYQETGVRAIDLFKDGGGLGRPAAIKVVGELPIRLIRPGMAVEIDLDLAKEGKVSAVRTCKLLPVEKDPASLVFKRAEPQSNEDFQPAVVQAIVKTRSSGKIALQLPKSEFTSEAGLHVPLPADAKLIVDERDLREVQAGDEVVSAALVKSKSGDWVLQEIQVRLAADRKAVQTEPDQVYQHKYRHLSNEPEAPRELRSKNFLIKTDLSPRSAQILLDKLEDMFTVVSKYYNRRQLGQPIVCYVAEDLERWGADMDELAEGIESIRGEAGVTVSSRLGNLRKSTVYACGKHDVVQHESVHAFCHLAYGGTGPTWYAEGMAELGCYWRLGDVGVNVDPVVIRYLTTASPKPLTELIRLDQVTGDSWQAYAWRWALCYMLVNNPNYGKRFFKLGEKIMPPDGDFTFQTEFGDVASQISFEYQQFIKHLGNGYQQELCSWDWKTKADAVGANGKKSKVIARRGWQATGVSVEAGQTYQIQTEGTWTTDGRDPFSAKGLENGTGRLVGAILTQNENQKDRWEEYQLSEEIPLGEDATFSAPVTGHLFLRCKEKLTQIGDNQGEVKATIRKQ